MAMDLWFSDRGYREGRVRTPTRGDTGFALQSSSVPDSSFRASPVSLWLWRTAYGGADEGGLTQQRGAPGVRSVVSCKA